MRSKLTLVVLMLVVSVFAAPAFAGGTNLLAGLGWSLYSERQVDVHAGLSQHLKLMDRPDSRPRAVPAIDPPVIPVDTRYGLFDDIRTLQVNLLAMGVDPKRIQRNQMSVDGRDQGFHLNDYTLALDLQAQTPDEKIITAELTHDASRVEGEFNLIIFRIKTVKHVKTTDYVVQRFILVNVSDWIEWYVPRAFGPKVSPTSLTEDQKNLVRAAVLEDQMRDSLQFLQPLPRYGIQADAMTRQIQGAPGAFEALGSTEYGRALAEVQQLRDQLKQQIDSMKADEANRAGAAEAERKANEEKAAAAAKAQAEAEAAAKWPETLRAKHAGKTGFLFVMVGANGLPTGQNGVLHMWQLTSAGWKYNSASPFAVPGGEGTWFWADGQQFKWLGVGFSNGPDCQPASAYALHTTGLRIIAVQEGGNTYEVR